MSAVKWSEKPLGVQGNVWRGLFLLRLVYCDRWHHHKQISIRELNGTHALNYVHIHFHFVPEISTTVAYPSRAALSCSRTTAHLLSWNHRSSCTAQFVFWNWHRAVQPTGSPVCSIHWERSRIECGTYAASCQPHSQCPVWYVYSCLSCKNKDRKSVV